MKAAVWYLIRSLALEVDPRVKDLVIAVLIEFGAQKKVVNGETPQVLVERLCLQLLKMVPASELGELADKYVQAGTIAINVAYYLRSDNLLIEGMLHPSDFILDGTTDSIINLFLTDSESLPEDLNHAADVVISVSKRLVVLRFRQFRKTLRNVLIACLAVFFLEYKNRGVDPARWQKVTETLRETLVTLVRKIPVLNVMVSGRPGKQNTQQRSGAVRRWFVRNLAHFVIYIATILDNRGGFIIDMSSVRDFFRLSPEERQKYRIFVDHINSPDVQETIETLQKPLEELVGDKQIVASYIVAIPFVCAMRYNSDKVNQFLTDYFDYAFEKLGPTKTSSNLSGTVILSNLLITLRNTLIEDGHFKANTTKLANFKHVFENAEKIFWNRYATTVSEVQWVDIITYYYFANKLQVEPDFQLIRNVIRERLKRPDVDKTLGFFIHQVIVLGFHYILFDPEMATDLMLIMLQEIPENHIQNNREIWISSLLRMRAAAEYQTDLFLQEAPSERLTDQVKQAVRTGKPDFDIGARVGGAGSWFARDIMLEDDDTMRKYLQWFFYLALEAKDEREWLAPVIDIVIDGLFSGRFPDPDRLLAPYEN